jgi:2,3-bisphosphoglycerate-independent phosphoglycerate mutase
VLSRDQNPKFILTLLSLILLIIFSTSLSPASALTEIEVSPVNTPQGAVVLIVDGLSASFIYPELTPHALDGTTLEKAKLEIIPKIGKDSTRVLEFRAPKTFTEGGHSVLFTGNPDADSELLSFKDATIFDILHKENYLCLAVMEKGDFGSICTEQDVILKDENNSVKDMKIVLENHNHSSYSTDIPEIPEGLLEVFKDAADETSGYVKSKEIREKYSGYNRWGIETASAIVKYMAKNRPEQKYLLTVNVGAVDDSGHHRDNYGYIDCIECLDTDLSSLYELCKKNNLGFILTADHGMAFSKDGSRGGHQSDKLSATEEAQLVPLIVYAKDVKSGVVGGKHSQEDFAPTLLGILDIPDRPRFMKGKQIILTDHVNLRVKLPNKGLAELMKGGKPVASQKNDDQFLFLGLEPGSTYTIRATLDSGNSLEEQEKEILLESDSIVEFTEKGHTDLKSSKIESGSGKNIPSKDGFSKRDAETSSSSSEHLIAYLLIGLVNLAGLVIIAKMLKKN